jgi:hypothetical protein
LGAGNDYLSKGRLLGALSRDALQERSSSQFEKCCDLLMNQSRTAVLLAGINGGRIVDVETPLSTVVSETLNEGVHYRGCDGFDGVSLEGEGLGKDLAGKKYRMSAQKGDIDTCKLYHPGGKLGTLTALR